MAVVWLPENKNIEIGYNRVIPWSTRCQYIGLVLVRFSCEPGNLYRLPTASQRYSILYMASPQVYSTAMHQEAKQPSLVEIYIIQKRVSQAECVCSVYLIQIYSFSQNLVKVCTRDAQNKRMVTLNMTFLKATPSLLPTHFWYLLLDEICIFDVQAFQLGELFLVQFYSSGYGTIFALGGQSIAL